MSIEMNNYVI